MFLSPLLLSLQHVILVKLTYYEKNQTAIPDFAIVCVDLFVYHKLSSSKIR